MQTLFGKFTTVRATVGAFAFYSLSALSSIASAQIAPTLPHIDPTYRLSIGSAVGRDEVIFSRISGAVGLSTGEIVIANQGTQEIRWFSATGQWLRTVGRKGSGPGEYQGLRRLLYIRGDSVLAEDGIASRMTLYDRNGRLVRSWSVAGALANRPPIGRLSDGSFVALTERAQTRPPGHIKYQATLLRSRGGSVLDTIGQLPGSEGYDVPCGEKNTAMCNVGVPYGVRAVATTSGDQVFAGNGDRYEIIAFTPALHRVDTIGYTAPPVLLSPARIEFFRDSLTADIPANRKALARAKLAGAPARKTLPFFSQLVADDAGRLWVARPQEMGASQRNWDVLTTRGVFLGTVQLPSRLSVTQIANGYIVGITKDADDVESVQLLRFTSR